jgi:hypothetical protein
LSAQNWSRPWSAVAPPVPEPLGCCCVVPVVPPVVPPVPVPVDGAVVAVGAAVVPPVAVVPLLDDVPDELVAPEVVAVGVAVGDVVAVALLDVLAAPPVSFGIGSVTGGVVTSW